MSSPVRPTVLPYLRLGGSCGWTPLLDSRFLDFAGGALALGVPGSRQIALDEPLGSIGGLTLVRGTAIGPGGELLVADAVRRTIWIHRQPVAGPPQPAPGFTELWPARPLPVPDPADLADPPHPPADPYTLLEPVDLAFTPAGDLVIADAAAARLLVLAWPTAALRAVVALPGWRPVAVAVDARGRCHVADAAAGTVHRFTARWRRDAGYPHHSTVLANPWQLAVVRPQEPAGGQEGNGCAECSGDGGAACSHPSLVVLDGATAVLLDERGRALPSGTALPELLPPALRREKSGQLSFADPAWPHHLPLVFEQLMVDRTGVHPGTGLALLAMGHQVRLQQAGRLRLGPLTGATPGFAWDRLVLDADIPDGTEILASTLTSNGALEPPQLDEPGAAWSAPVAIGAGEPTEMLVRSAAGERLWIELELRGTGTRTPVLRRLDVHAPRSSSLNLLPPGYRQEPDSADFLDRFLSYFDTVFAEVEATHRNVAKLLDARTVPAGAALDWLGSWFGLRFEQSWDAATRRRVIDEAMDYATERGTVPGIQRLLRWHTALPAPWPAVIEHFRVPAGSGYRVGGGELPDAGAAHQVTIVLPASVAPDEEARHSIDDLLARHLPAHVRIRMRYINPGVVLGTQSSLSVDTLLPGAPASRLGTAALGIDTGTVPNPGHHLPAARRTPC